MKQIVLINLLFVHHKTANQIRNFIGGGIQSKMARIKNVNLSFWHITAIGLRLGKVERQVVFSP